jgi:hypothetical protein
MLGLRISVRRRKSSLLLKEPPAQCWGFEGHATAPGQPPGPSASDCGHNRGPPRDDARPQLAGLLLGLAVVDGRVAVSLELAQRIWQEQWPVSGGFVTARRTGAA